MCACEQAIAVTFSGKDIQVAGFKNELSDDLSKLVVKRAAMAKASGCVGVVCSGMEVKMIKKDIGNITLFAFDAKQGLSEHTAPFDAVVYILDGQAQITVGDKTSTVTAGEMLIMPANIAHALHAEEKFKMLLVMIRGK